MSEVLEQEANIERIELVESLLQEGTLAEVCDLLEEFHPAETAHLIEALPPDERLMVWELLDIEEKGDVLAYLRDEVRRPLIATMSRENLITVAKSLDLDDLVDFLQELPDSVINMVLQSMDAQHRRRIEAVLSYPEDSAGGLMNTDAISVRADITLDVVQRYLRWLEDIPESTDSLMVVNRHGKYLGILRLTDLLTRDPGLTVAEVFSPEVEGIPATMAAEEVVALFHQRDLVSAPVVDDVGKLLGRITIDDVVDVIRDNADHSLMSMAGLSEENDMFAPVIKSSRQRAVWLGINLLTAFLASWVIGLFGATIEKLVALAILMPIVASMGGVAGSQTLTLVIRGMALGQLGESNTRRLIAKEIAVGTVNGMVWALVVGGVAAVWFDDVMLGVVIGMAIVINLFAAAFAGTWIPLILRRLGIDPALAGSVVLTTVTDVVGFMSFLGLATLMLI